MQREIKFRAEDDCNGDWITGMPLYDADITGRLYIMYSYSDGIIVKPQTLGQFTGLTDKNGVEIYEGDIIFDSHNKGSVYYNEDECQFLIDFKDENTTLLDIGFWGEIIGNIHQHAHLLE